MNHPGDHRFGALTRLPRLSINIYSGASKAVEIGGKTVSSDVILGLGRVTNVVEQEVTTTGKISIIPN